MLWVLSIIWGCGMYDKPLIKQRGWAISQQLDGYFELLGIGWEDLPQNSNSHQIFIVISLLWIIEMFTIDHWNIVISIIGIM